MGFSLGGLFGGGNQGGTSASTSSTTNTASSEVSFSGTSGGASIANTGNGTIDSDTTVYGTSAAGLSSILDQALSAVSPQVQPDQPSSSPGSGSIFSSSTLLVVGIAAAIALVIIKMRK